MANTYYVATNGNDSNPGTLASPLRTIDAGWAKIQNAGDTLCIRGGTYTGSDNMPLIFNKSGRSGAYITVSAYNGEEVIIDGQYTYPSGNPINYSDACAAQNPLPASGDGLIDIKAEYFWLEGITVKNSRGLGIRVFTYSNNPRPNNVTIKDCKIQGSRRQNLLLEGNSINYDGPNAITIDGLESTTSGSFMPYQHGSVPCDWSASITCKAVTNTTFKNCVIHTNYGEGLIVDAFKHGSNAITIQDCEFYNNMAGYLSIHAARDVVVERCAFYETSDTPFTSGADGVAIVAGEARLDIPFEYLSRNVTVRNCLFVKQSLALGLRRAGSPMGTAYIYNNTFAGNDLVFWCNQFDRIASAKTYLRNNVVHNNTTLITTDNASAASLDCNYNHWQSTPGYATMQGANDVTGNPSLVNASYVPTAGDFNPAPLRLQSGSTAIDAGTNLTSAVPDDYFGVTRTGTWDMGAHEYDGVSYPTPTATAAASTTTPAVDDTVNFTATPAAGTSPYTFLWNFGDGTTSTTQNPSKAYGASGTYTVTLTVTDANNIKATDTETINVSPLPSSGGSATPPSDVEVVTFDAGDATFTVTRTPSWILFFATGAAADNTVTADVKLIVGLHDAVNNQSYCFAGFVDDNVSTTQVAEQMFTDKAIVFPDYLATAQYYATVSSVSSTQVALSWSGTAATGKITAVCVSGSAWQSVLATVAAMTTNGTGTTISGDYNVAVMPATLRDDGNQGIIDFSLGFAKRGGDQMCLGWHSRDGQSASSTKAILRTDRIAARPHLADSVEITSWTSSGITLTPRGRDLNADLPILLLKVDTTKADVYIGAEDVPTSGSATDYALGFDPAAVIMLLSTLAVTDTTKDDSTSGVFGIATVDDGGTDRTMLVYDKDGAAPTVAKSYTNNDWIIKDYAGTTVAEGSASVSGNNLRLTLTGTVPSTAYKMLVFAIQEGATPASGPTADFSHDVTSDTVYGDTVTVQDLSVGDGTNALSSWDVDWGDGNSDTGLTPGASETHVYTSAGTYTITVTVTDAGANEDSTTREISIGTPAPTASFTISPTSGAAGTTFTLDASGSTAGGNETIDVYEWIVHNIGDSSQVGVGGTGAITFYLVGETVTLDIPEAGDWIVEFALRQANTEVWAYASGTIPVTRDDITLDFRNVSGSVTAVGAYTATFTADLNYGNLDAVTFAWDFGDTGTSSGAGQSEVSHEYASVVGSTSYTVKLVVTLPDGTTLTETKTDYITIIPSPTVPPLLSALKTRVDELDSELDEIRKHMGALYGATWSQESSPNTNVYTTEVTNAQWAAAFSTFALKENGTALSTQTSLANVQANAGSAWVRYAAGTVTISVHPTGSGSPATNGNYYRWTAS